MFVGKVVGQRDVRTELLESGFALRSMCRPNRQGSRRRQGRRFKFGDRRTHLGDTADDFVAGNAGVNGGHQATPLVASLVEIGVADAAKQDFDLHVVFSRIARERWWSKPAAMWRWQRRKLLNFASI